jgi:rod shape-determining protein MreD
MMVGMAWSVGLVVDIVSFGLPGVYALSKAVLVYLARVLALRVRTYPLWQQTIVVLGLLGIEALILTLIDFIVSGDLAGLQRWTAVVVGALVWPVVYWILRRARHLARLGH